MSEWEGETTAHAAEGPQWVSAAEAADAAGVTPGTVRYWARNGLIVSEVVNGPAGERTLVRLDEVLQHARHESPAGAGQGPGGGVVTDLPARTSELAPILKSIPEIMAQLTAATDRAARAETKVEFLSAQLAELRRRLNDAEAASPAAADPVVPPAWEAPAPAEPPREESPGVSGWPAPPADAVPPAPDLGAATSDAPAVPETTWGYSEGESAEPGPESIDWGADVTDDAEGLPATSGGTERASETSPRTSLEEMWAQPSRPDPWATAGTDEATTSAPAAPSPADSANGVQWHEPAVGGNEPESEAAPEPPPPPARPANATVPDEFYGPRRRRWFKRRK
jgi:hypothetical protein